MAGLQQTYLFSVLGHTRGQGLNDWDLLQENKSENKIKGSVLCDQSINAKIAEPSFLLPV